MHSFYVHVLRSIVLCSVMLSCVVMCGGMFCCAYVLCCIALRCIALFSLPSSICLYIQTAMETLAIV